MLTKTKEAQVAAAAGETKQMTMIQALRSALDVMMERDDNVVVFGEDVGYFGGVFRVTEGLQAKYGKSRCFDTPINEGGIVGAAVGMGAYGLRPVAEIQFADYFYPAYDQIVSEAARLRHRSAGDFTCPLTIRMPCGGGIYGGQTHSQSPEALFTHVCGLRTVIPSNPYDAKGLLISAIECDDPVVFLEPKRLYWAKETVDLGDRAAGPFGRAAVRRAGTDATLVAYGPTVPVALQAAEAAAEDGISLEVVDLRTLVPLDYATVFESVRKTGRGIVVHGATEFCGLGSEIAATVNEVLWRELKAPMQRLGALYGPIAFARVLETQQMPAPASIIERVRQLSRA